jgi:molecular chaperone GrpE
MNSHRHSRPEPQAEAGSLVPEDAGPELIPPAQPADPAPDIGQLLRKAEDEAAALKDSWLRARADVENVRKQAQNDVARAHKYAIEKFAEELLPVKDALEAALVSGSGGPAALQSGVELTLKQLTAAFDKAQIVELNPLGEKFDPHRHQAMAVIDSGEPANTVVQVFQKGYMLNDRVLRPAMVVVAKARDDGA